MFDARISSRWWVVGALPQGFVSQHGHGDRHVEGVRRSVHRNGDGRIGGGERRFGETGVLGADKKGKGPGEVGLPKQNGGARVGGHDPSLVSPGPGNGLIEAGDGQRHREDGPGRCSHHVRAERIGLGIRCDQGVGPHGVSSAEQGTKVPRLLDRLGDQKQGVGPWCQVVERHVELAEDADHTLRPGPIRGPVQGLGRYRHLGLGALRGIGEACRVEVDLERPVTMGDSPLEVSGAFDEEYRLPVALFALKKRDETLDPGIRRRGDLHQTAQRSR